ncbi:MAG: tetratricopeptide repeat protein, partial [Ardenticatenaceae bacterium]
LEAESTALFRETDDRWSLALALASLGQATLATGDNETAPALFHESLALWREVEDHWGLALSTHQFAWFAYLQGDHATARRLFEESNALFQEFGEKWHVGHAWNYLGHIARFQGENVAAELHYRNALALLRELGNKPGPAVSLYGLGQVARQRGDYHEAVTWFRESYRLFQELSSPAGIASCLEGLGEVVSAQGGRAAAVQAAQLLATASRLREESGRPIGVAERPNYERAAGAIRATLGADTFATAWEAGRAMTLAETISVVERLMHDPDVSGRPSSINPAGLTDREIEVLRLVAQGLTDAQVAQRLVVSPRTVNSHLRSIYSKLDVTSRSAATRYALEHHLG